MVHGERDARRGTAPGAQGSGPSPPPQPVALLARLGDDVGHEGFGLGAGMLTDVIIRTLALGEEIGCRGLLIHSETVDARDFYLHLVPELETSRTDGMHLYLLMKDIRRTWQ